MSFLKSYFWSLCLILTLTTGGGTFAQQKRTSRVPRKAPAPAIAPINSASIDTLLAKDTYKIYAEARNVGQLIRSNSAGELLEPVMKLAAPPKELKTLIKWLNVHAEEVMTSRMMVATWPTARNVPDMIVALEFDSPDEAEKFLPQLNSFLPKVFPTPTPVPTNSGDEKSTKPQASPLGGFAADLQFVKNGHYAYIYVFSRKDGGPIENGDAVFLRANLPQVSDWVSSGEAHKVIAGTNVNFAGDKLELVKTRFVVENFSANRTVKPKPDEAANAPRYHLQQVGSLILITPIPVTLKSLRPTGSKLLAEELSFRVARTRFSSEQVFIYVDVRGLEQEEEDRSKKLEAEGAQQLSGNRPTSPDEPTSLPEEQKKVVIEPVAPNAEVEAPSSEASPAPEPDPFEPALGMVASSFFGGQSKWPDAFGFGISFENESLDVKALMVNRPGEKSDALPIFPNLIPAAPILPESPSILPVDTELFVMFSLDLPQIYAAMTRPPVTDKPGAATVLAKPPGLPFTDIENRLKINIQDDLLPLLGSEIVVSMPVKFLEGHVVGIQTSSPAPSNEDSQPASSEPSFVFAISLRDKEGMKALLPKIVDSIGFKGASAFAQKERREDIEIVSYGNMFSYAFVANFLVVSANVATVRHVVDCYIKREILSSDTDFKNYTRWQPQQLQGQVYVSPALMKNYQSWIDQQSMLMSDQLRELIGRLLQVAQPVTYSLSSDGLGTLHELHIPKNLVLMAVAGISAESNPTPILVNERAAIASMYTIANAQSQYRSGKGAGSFGTLEQLQAEGFIAEEMVERPGYKINLTVLATKFELTATPLEYGKSGKTSYYINETSILRGADHNGGMAMSSDPPIK